MSSRNRDLLIGIRGLVNNYSGLVACRFFLGLMEGLSISGHHSLHSRANQVDSFLELLSISLLSIPGRGYNYGILEIGTATHIHSNVLLRISAFYVSSSLSGAFSGLLAAAIDQINGQGGKQGWAWIFILVRCTLTVS